MRILVTGSAGLIGSSIVDILLDQGHQVSGIDNLSVCPFSNVPKRARGTFYEVDLMDKGEAELIISEIQPEVVYHCAAWAHEGLAQFSPILLTENNLMIFLNTLIPAINAGMSHIVVPSSIAVYGDQKAPFTEDMSKKPIDIYATNKAFMEDSVSVLSKVHGFTYSIFRAYNVFGAKQSMTDPYRGVVAIFMNKMLKNEPIYIYGDGEQKRSLSYINDIAPTLVECGLNKKAYGEIFNVGDDRVYSINDLVRAIEKAAGKEFEKVYLPDRAQEVKIAYCDNTKAKKVLGLKTETDFQDAINETWAFAKAKGPQTYKYLDSLELVNEKVPSNWLDKK